MSAIVTRGKDILLIHRKKEGREYWVVPGGGVEENETLEQGLVREVKEETGLNLIKHALIAQNIDEGIEHDFYICELSNGEPILGGPEAEENNPDNSHRLEWVDKDKILKLSLYPNHLKNLTDKIFG